MIQPETNDSTYRRIKVEVQGIVQGVGFRPYVWQRAKRFQLTGWVFNHSAGVTIEVEGTDPNVDAFLDRFLESMPPLACVDRWEVNEIETIRDSDFVIRTSQHQPQSSTPVSPDVSICDSCLRELVDPADRRFQYPFINCTHCGPRFTIIRDLPYDRHRTTMQAFPMCDQCQSEYDDPADRRFHAQPNACHDCGPMIWLATHEGSLTRPLEESSPHTTEQVVQDFHQRIAAGEVIAVKGVGGFHLACDATQTRAIETLRQRKGRVDKPLAVMVGDLDQARQLAHLDDQQAWLLTSPQRPIVLLPRRQSSPLSAAVAPGNDFVGIMLPYSPLHQLISSTVPLVMTSGNLTDEPIAISNQEALDRLGSLADAFLLHDRQIQTVCDDSVVRCIDGKRSILIRRSRGFSPDPIRLSRTGPSVLAIGGEIKSTFCLTRDDYAYLSQHIGDMGNVETLSTMQDQVQHFQQLFGVDLQAVVADMHPGYLSGQWARQLAEELGLPLIRVQHHVAHVAALRAELRFPPDARLLGCCFDGTGYGADGTIWGGEFLLIEGKEFLRVGYLNPFPLPGGDVSIKRPYRIALALLHHCGVDWDTRFPCAAQADESERNVLRKQLNSNLNCIPTSSIGRLFDAVASILGVRHEVSYEGQAAMELEALARSQGSGQWNEAFRIEIGSEVPYRWNIDSLIRSCCAAAGAKGGTSQWAFQFHMALAVATAETCRRLASQFGLTQVGLTGGVFQNALLLELVERELQEVGLEPLSHRQVPPNDGGIALGQASLAQLQVGEG